MKNQSPHSSFTFLENQRNSSSEIPKKKVTKILSTQIETFRMEVNDSAIHYFAVVAPIIFSSWDEAKNESKKIELGLEPAKKEGRQVFLGSSLGIIIYLIICM